MKKCTRFKEQKGRRYIWENVYFGIIVFSCLSSTKPCLGFLLICFVREIKGFYQSSLGNEVDFRDIMNVFPKYLGQKLKCQKTETWFCRWKSNDSNDINIFLALENPCTFLFLKEKTWKRIFSAHSELSQNLSEQLIVPSKTTINWLLNGIWCYLFIGCFDWKIGVFQKTVVWVYYILQINTFVFHHTWQSWLIAYKNYSTFYTRKSKFNFMCIAVIMTHQWHCCG